MGLTVVVIFVERSSLFGCLQSGSLAAAYSRSHNLRMLLPEWSATVWLARIPSYRFRSHDLPHEECSCLSPLVNCNLDCPGKISQINLSIRSNLLLLNLAICSVYDTMGVLSSSSQVGNGGLWSECKASYCNQYTWIDTLFALDVIKLKIAKFHTGCIKF